MTIDAYIAKLEPIRREVLTKLRAVINEGIGNISTSPQVLVARPTSD